MALVILVDLLHRRIPRIKTNLNKNVSAINVYSSNEILFYQLPTKSVAFKKSYALITALICSTAGGGSPETAGVSALHGISLQGFYPIQLPQLTPGLSQYVKDDLTEHVRGWPAETCERQVRSLLDFVRRTRVANKSTHIDALFFRLINLLQKLT